VPNLTCGKICARVKIGRGSIINTGASVDHECQIDFGAHLGPNSMLCGRVEVVHSTFIGAGAVINIAKD
jgi:UDP-3-O-[3-hydroxymyristoyl] glucosamine N-acyltransferase